jgi:Tfp pilus assembly protein PilF
MLALAPQREHQAAAVSLLEHAASQRPEDALLLGELGLAYYRTGRIQEARSAFDRALKRRPDDPDLVNNLAWILCEHERDPRAAEEVAARVVRATTGRQADHNLMDTWGVVQYRLGILEKSRRRLEESREWLELCLRDPRTSPATRASATVHLARTLAELDRPEGRKLLEELLADSDRSGMLSAADMEEAERLLEHLPVEQVPD